jgi:hypothetical protein
MGRNKAFTRGRVYLALVAGLIGYLIGGWHPATTQTQILSAAQSVALRFPQQWRATPPAADTADLAPAPVLVDASATAPAAANSADDPAMFDPEPMVPQPFHQAVSQAPAAVQLATVDAGSLPPLNATETAPSSVIPGAPVRSPKTPAIAAAPLRANRAPAVATSRVAMNRPGFMLDDAQIVSIKERLHLTPDQQQMWPAVEAALRNIAYTRAQQARRRGFSGDTVQVAAIDPESVEGLKSAAVPLIMSFDDEQKQEVRNLAHVMGLDQLASEF